MQNLASRIGLPILPFPVKAGRLFSLVLIATISALTLNTYANAEEFVVADSFNGDPAGSSLESHVPEQDEIGGGWIEAAGSDFRVTLDGLAVAATGINGAPGIAIIDTLMPEYDVQARFTRTNGKGLIGGVFRYVDQSNYFAAYHDGQSLKLVKVVDGAETVLDQAELATQDVVSAIGIVKVRADSIRVILGTSAELETTDSTFHGSTLVGMLSQSIQTTSFRDFRTLGLSPEPGDEPKIEPSPAVLFDSFTEADGTQLPDHDATEVRPGGPWTTIRGTWSINGGKAQLTGADPVEPFTDQLVAIETGDLAEPEISADITWNGGTAGIAWDVADSSNYSIVFWDGFYLVAGRVDAGIFRERGRQSFNWVSGETKTLRARVNGSNTRVYVDGENPIAMAVGLGAGSGGGSGFFVRGNSTSAFDNFTVRVAQPLAQPDPIIEPDAPAPPDTTPVPEQAWVFDSFDAANGVQLQHRNPEIDPASQGWEVVSGNWQMFERKASEQTGVFGDGPQDKLTIIDTGRDEYELDAIVEWDGGRVGILFGGRSNGGDDSGRNGFLFFRNGDSLETGKLIGGTYFPISETTDFDWPEGARRTMRVVVEDGSAKMFLGGDLKLEIADSDLTYSTWAGIFQRGRNDDRIDDFTVTVPDGVEPPGLSLQIVPIADAEITPGNTLRIPLTLTGPGAGDATITATASPAGGSSNVVFDSFDGQPSVPISQTRPEIAPSGAKWLTLGAPISEPFIHIDSLQLPGAQDGGDQRVVIETGYSDMTVKSEILGQWGRFGIVARHDGSSDDENWVMGWMDFYNQVLLLGRSTDGEFRLLSASAFNWGIGESKELQLSVIGDAATLSVDGQQRLAAIDENLSSGTYAGLFARSDVYSGIFGEFAVEPHGLPEFMSISPSVGGGFEMVVSPVLGDSGEFAVEIEAISGSQTASSSFTVTVLEPVAPTADAGGPYLALENTVITLDGTISIADGAPIVEYLWDIDQDGTADLTGPNPELALDHPVVLLVTLTVVDSLGFTSQSSAEVLFGISQPQIDLLELFLLGAASNSEDGALSLTGSSLWAGGAAWITETQNVTDGFVATFDFTFDNFFDGESGADGIAFVLHSSPVGIEAIGLPGSGMGYELIENSISIEIDNWANSEFGETGPHVAVHSAGTGANGPSDTTRLASAELAPIAEGSTHTVRVAYESGILKVYVDDLSAPIIELEIDIAGLLDLEDGMAFVGFTAGSGGAAQSHNIEEFYFASAS